MKKTLVLVVVLVGALSLVTGASARPNPQHAKLLRLGKEVKVLRHRLGNMRAARIAAVTALAKERAKTASLQSQVATLEAQNASLQAHLTQITNERDAALAQLSPPLSVAVEQVRR